MQGDSFGRGFMGVVALVVAAGVFWYGAHNKNLAEASAGWPSAKGSVLSSSVRNSYSGTGRDRRREYSAQILYGYEVDGRRYKSSRIAFKSTRSSRSKSTIENYVGNYPVDSAVTVYYDPDDPSSAVLLRGQASASNVPYIVGWAAVAVGALLLVNAFTGWGDPLVAFLGSGKDDPDPYDAWS